MRKILSLLAMMALAGCGGGGGGSSPAPNPNPPSQATTAPQGDLVTPSFTFFITPRGSSSGQRKPNFVSTATKSVKITLNTVNGNPPAVNPKSVTTDIDNSGGACNPPTGCTISGPPSPPGVPDNYTVTTYDATGGGGNALDTNSVTFTPTVGTANNVSITLNGIPFSVTIAPLSSQTVDTAGQTQNLTVTVKDHAGQTITGTYANFVTITDPDPATYGAGVKGTSLSGTHTGSCTTSCVIMQTDTDVATLTYNGLAEDPVTLTSTTSGVTGGNAGTATFTPTLHAITRTGGDTSQVGPGPGVDLYTTDSSSTVGYSGTESYHEDGYTDSPYNKVLTTIDGTSCAAFASISAADVSNDTVFTITATNNTAGSCNRVVSDGLAAANHGTGGPSFVVTYTTSSITASSKHRKQ